MPDGGTLADQMARIARVTEGAGPVVSVYLSTRGGDEQHRERTRLFLKAELQHARAAHPGEALAAALDWIQSEAEARIVAPPSPGVDGVALFACPAAGLRDVLQVSAPLKEVFRVAEAPFLRPLAALLGTAPSSLVVFVDGESARLIPLSPGGAEDEVRLESVVSGHHRAGGWAQLALLRYQHRLEGQRHRHLEAVADTLGRLVDEHDVERVVFAGEPGTLAALRRVLPPRLGRLVVGSVTASRHEPAASIAERAAATVAEFGGRATEAAVDEVLGDAGGGHHAVAGLEAVLGAVQLGAVRHLYLAREFREPGHACPGCNALQPGASPTCRRCGHPATPAELGDTMVERVLATGGTVTLVETHEGLARVGGVVARLRFSL